MTAIPPEVAPRRRIPNLVIAAAAVALIAAGLIILSGYPHSHDAAQAYTTASFCHNATEALHDPCYFIIGATVDAAGVGYRQNGAPDPTITLHNLSEYEIPSATVAVVQPPAAFHKLHKGDAVAVKVFAGRPTAVFTTSGTAMRLDGNPLNSGSLYLTGGAAVIAIGALILLVVLPTTVPSGHLLRIFGAPGAHSLWYRDSNIVGHVTADRALLTGYVAFVIAELGDVLSSVLGNRSGTFEQNDLVAALLQIRGNIAFLEMKAPALIAGLFILGRAPRRVALAVAWAAVAGMAYVVIGNLLLAHHQSIAH